MVKWSKRKVNENDINKGNEYEKKDRVARGQLNAIVNNSLYAADIAEDVAEQLSNLGTDEKIEFKGSNPNLLINGDFSVNQRGKESYSGANVYSVDRWLLTGATTSFNSGTKQFTTSTQYGSFRQIIENYTDYAGKTMTLSCKVSNVSGNDLYLALADGSQTKQFNITKDGVFSVTTTISTSPTRLICMLYKTGTAGNLVEATIEYMKLEIGLISTAFSPRPYAEELAMCQRYYQILRVDNCQYCSNTNVMYPNIITIGKLRATPTVTVKTNISVRGNGSIVGELTSFTGIALIENMLVCNANVSGFGTVLGELYTFTNGKITADAEIYS